MGNKKKLRNNYIFMDFENVQPSSLKFPKDYPFTVFVFVGVNQTKIPLEFAALMQNLGDNAKYILISGTGKNVLNFHITFYQGKMYAKDPDGYFHIITRDTGFDILIKHLREQKVLINRYDNINKIPALKQSSCEILPMNKKIQLTVDYLIKRGNAKPKKIETLSNTINLICAKSLSSNQLDNIIKTMVEEKLIVIDGDKITYTLQR